MAQRRQQVPGSPSRQRPRQTVPAGGAPAIEGPTSGTLRASLLRALHEVAVATAGVLDPSELAHLVVDRARDLLDADAAGLYWWEASEGVLRRLADNDPNQSALESKVVVPGQGVAGVTFQRAEPLVVSDYPTWEHATSWGAVNGVRSNAAVPLAVNGRTAGALVVRSYGSRRFQPEHVEFLTLLAAQIGPALEAARLHAESERRRAEAEALAELVRQGATERDTERVVGLICEQAHRSLQADYAGVQLTDEQGRRRWHGMWGSRSEAWRRRRMSRGTGPAAQAVAAGRTVVLEQLPPASGQATDLPVYQQEGARTVLATPLSSQAGLVGALVVGWRTEVSPTAGHIRLAEALAGYASTILENAHAHALAEQRTRELAESETRFRQLAEHIREVFWLTDPAKQQVLYLSPGYEAIWGRPCAEVYASPQRWIEAVHPEDRERVRRAALTKQVLGTYDEEYRILRPGGGVRWVRDRAFPVRDGRGRVYRIAGLAEDITERKQAEAEQARLIQAEAARAEAEAAQRRLTFLAEASAVLAASLDYETTLDTVARLAVPELADWCSVTLLDPDGQLRRVALAHPTGQEALALRWAEHQPDPHSHSPVARTISTGESQLRAEVSDELLRTMARDAQHLHLLRALSPVSYMIVPLSGRGRTLGAVSFISAESGRRYGPAELALAEALARRCALAVDNARLYEELHQALRLRDELLTMVSHDLKNPLTLIKGYARILQRGAANLDQVLSIIDTQADTMRRMIDQLLDAARLRAGGKLELLVEEIDLFELAARLVDRHQISTERHQLRLLGPGPGAVVGRWDRGRLEQILENLLSNAIKYSPRGGLIEVSVEREGESARLEVRDEGLGISQHALPHLFEPFYRAAVPTLTGGALRIAGLGLGLFSAQQLANLHGGRIEVASQEGRGSSFTLALPLAGPSRAEPTGTLQ